MKIKHFFLMAAFGLMATACGNLDNPLEDIQGGGSSSSENNSEDEVIAKYEFKITDLKAEPTDLTNDITSLTMTNTAGEEVFTVTSVDGKLSKAPADFPSITAGEYWFEAKTSGDKVYIAKVNVDPSDFTTETAYTLPMATIGDVILSDGTFAAKDTDGEQAVIAYVGKVDKYFDRFLAIALEDANDGSLAVWNSDNANEKANNYAYLHPITIGGTTYKSYYTSTSYYYDVVSNDYTVSSATATKLEKGWRIPSVTDWRYIFDGIGRINGGMTLTATNSNGFVTYSSNATPDNPKGVTHQMHYGDDVASSLLTAICNACGKTTTNNIYWTSSYNGSTVYPWYYIFDASEFKNADGANCALRVVFAY